MFDAPIEAKATQTFDFEFPFDEKPWSVGLLVGPSGSGKSTVMRHVWGEPRAIRWGSDGIVDDFDAGLSPEQIARALSSIGFSTIPAWVRPHRVLSVGEQFRADIARRLLEDRETIVVDEYTSVVDRQVAKIASHAIQKYVRAEKKQFVAVGCHYDVLDWLQPDWVLDMQTRSFTRRLLQRRPALDCSIGRVPPAAWSTFAPFHYLTARLPPACHGFGLWVGERLACTLWVAVFPHPSTRDIVRVARVVTLPDYQGLGLAFVLMSALGSALRASGRRLRNYPAHPGFVESHQRSNEWREVRGVEFSSSKSTHSDWTRATAVFEYCGSANSKFAVALDLQRGLVGSKRRTLREILRSRKHRPQRG